MTAYETDNLEMLDILDNVVTGTGIIGHSVETRERIFNAEGNIAASMAKKEKAAAAQITANNKSLMTQYSGMVISAALDDRNSPDPAVARKAQMDISNALLELQKMAARGVEGADKELRLLTNFIDAQENAERDEVGRQQTAEQEVLDEAAEQQHLQDVLQIEQAVLDFDNPSEAIEYLQNQKALGLISATEETKALNSWREIKAKAPLAKLHLTQDTSPARQIRKNFVTGLGLSNEFGLTSGAKNILKYEAINQFNSLYIKGLAAAQDRKGADLDEMEQWDLAERIAGLLIPLLQDRANAVDAQTAKTDNNQAISDAAIISDFDAIQAGTVVPSDAALIGLITGITGGSD